MESLAQKNRNRQINIRMDEDTLAAAVALTRSQNLSVVTRKLIMLWLTNETLQKEVRLSEVQSLHELEEK